VSTAAQPPGDALFAGLRIIEIADDPAGELTGKTFASFGAEVIKVELPEGAASRHVGPSAGDGMDVEESLTFWFYNTNKQSVVIDYRTDAGRAQLMELVAGADICITTLGRSAPPDLTAPALAAESSSLIVVSITPFGLTGPWAEWKSSDLVGLALGGPLVLCGYDDHSISPIRPGGDQAFHITASFANIATMLALLERQNTGAGQLVDIAMHDCAAVTTEVANPFWFYPKRVVQRQTCRHAQPSPTQPTLFACGDGNYVCFMLFATDQEGWVRFVEWLDTSGLALDLADPTYLEPAYRQKNFAHIQELTEVFFLMRSAEEAYLEGQERKFAIGALKAPEDVLVDSHLAAREFFSPVKQQDGSEPLFPRSALRFSTVSETPQLRAPRLGEHTARVLEAN
jgi:crotonobetainyl-CoA:carnitine CoA-transferase CaiB-like acyl-CoA transferase